LTDDDIVFIFSESDSNIYNVIYVQFRIFFCLIQGTNGENETDRMIIKVETILGYNLNDAAF